MAERIDIVVSERGSRTVKRNIDDIGNSARRSASAVNLFTKALAFIGAGAAIRGLVQLADTYTNIQNRIRTVTSSQEELTAVTEELFRVSRDTRSSFEATAEVYARTALATRELGISQQQTIDFTESLNQAVILSGASAQEAQAALIQLSQGLASGALRGDELRSVLEQLPVVADVIADQLETTRGALRDLGKDGALTAEVILEAFKNARGELAERFAETVPTISQAFQVLRDSVLRSVGEFDAANGISRTFAQTLLNVAANIDILVRGVAGLAVTFALLAGPRAIGAAINALRLLAVAALSNPFTAIATAIAFIVGQLTVFSDQIFIAEGSMTTLQDIGVATFEAISDGLRQLVAFFSSAFPQLSTFMQNVFGDVEFSIQGVLQVTARTVDGIVGFFKGGANAIGVAFENLPATLELIFVNMFNSVSRLFTGFLNSIIEQINRVRTRLGQSAIDLLQPFQLEASRQSVEIGERINEEIANGIKNQTGAQDALEGIFARGDELAQERLAKQAEEEARAAKRAELLP